MFKFKPTTQTYSDPVSATFVPGIPFGREYSRGDICFYHEGFAASKIFLNSKVLREAMLNSADYLEEVLNIKITDKAPKKKEIKADKAMSIEDLKTPTEEPKESDEPKAEEPKENESPEVPVENDVIEGQISLVEELDDEIA